LKGFEEALRHNDVYFALVRVGLNEWHPRNLEQRKKLAEYHRTEKVRADLNALIDWLHQSEQALSRRKPGPSGEDAQNVYLFVDSIDNALHHYTSKGLTRGRRHRRMVEQIFAIAAHKGQKVGRGTIDTAMRKVIADRKDDERRPGLPGAHFAGPPLSRHFTMSLDGNRTARSCTRG